MGVFDGRGETLRSLHLLATLLDLGYPLDASMPLLARLSETRHLRAMWGLVHGRLFEGQSLSEALLGLQGEGPFPTPLVALIEVGEMQGDLCGALRAACAGEAFDVFRSRDVAASAPPVVLPKALLGAPVPRAVAAVIKRAIAAGAERVGLFAGAPEAALGPWGLAPPVSAGVWTREEPDTVAEGAALPMAVEGDPEPLDALWAEAPAPPGAPPPVLGPRFDPAVFPRGNPIIGALRPDGWHDVVRPPAAIFPRLVRYCLFRARLPYWRRQRASGEMCFELESTRQRLPVEYAPAGDLPSLIVDLRGIYR
jgi:hypothetical protein